MHNQHITVLANNYMVSLHGAGEFRYTAWPMAMLRRNIGSVF